MNELTKSEVVTVVNRLMESIRNHQFRYEGQAAKITVSMGGAFFPDDADHKLGLIKTADRVLYEAKNKGRDRFECCFDVSVDSANRISEPSQSADMQEDTTQGLPN